jgi:hypothetical protein
VQPLHAFGRFGALQREHAVFGAEPDRLGGVEQRGDMAGRVRLRREPGWQVQRQRVLVPQVVTGDHAGLLRAHQPAAHAGQAAPGQGICRFREVPAVGAVDQVLAGRLEHEAHPGRDLVARRGRTRVERHHRSDQQAVDLAFGDHQLFVDEAAGPAHRGERRGVALTANLRPHTGERLRPGDVAHPPKHDRRTPLVATPVR